MFLLRCHHASAVGATNEAGESEYAPNTPGAPFGAEKSLHQLEFDFGDHALVRAFKPLSTAYRVLEPPTVDRVREETVERGTRERAPMARAEAPVLVSKFQDPGD